MSRQVQAQERGRPEEHRFPIAGLLCLLGALTLAACGARGVTLEDVAVDKSIVTGALDSTKPPADQISDETTIVNAVSSANLRQFASLSWANSTTGSQGVISEISETETNGILCRSFRTSRESFRGVALHAGETCRDVNGNWRMRRFSEV